MKEKARKLYDIRLQIGVEEAKIEPLKAERDALQAELLQEMKEAGQLSAKYDFATVSLAVRKTLKVNDEEAVIKALKEQGLDNEYVETKPRLNSLFDSYAKEAVKTGVTLQGTEIRETEYLSLTKGLAKEEKRKVATS